jgi:hypothetical protein
LAEKALTNENLQKLVLEAKARWIASGLTSEQKAALEALRIEISDLNELHLGQAAGDLIQISRTAAGNAWFIDQTPSDDAEFERRTGFQPVSSDNGLKVRSTVEGVDLLTTLMHEMGHRLGLPDTYALRDRSSIMYGYLTRGERRLPAPNQARGAVLSTDETQRYLGATINIGTLPAGKSVTIVGTVLVNDPANTQLISSQGTVSGGNFASVLTDDPAFAGAANPTTTLVERPDATVVSLLRTDSNPNNTSDVGWQVVFSQPVSGLNVSHFALVNAGLTAPSITSVGTAIQASEPDTTWNISVSTGSGNGTLGLNMTNDAGALSHDITNLPSTGQVYTIDKIAPTTNNFNRQIPTTSSTNADTLVFRAIFSEAVVNVSADDFTITGTTATPTAVSAVNASTYDVTVSGGDLATVNGLVDLNLVAGNNIADLAGNPLASLLVGFDQLYTMDNTVPTVAMTSATGNPAANAVIPVTVQFSETVTGFDLTDITVAGGSKGNFVAVDGDTYTFDLTPTGPGVTVTADIAANAAQDAATNGNTAATQFTRSIVDAVSIAATTATAAEGGATGLYTFTRGASTGDLTVSFQLDAGSTATAATDFTLTSGGTLTFTPGTGAGTIVIPNGSLTATVTLTALTESPNAAEAAETARLNVVAASGYVVGASPNATVTITENSFLVTTTSDSGTGSLRQAVLNANSLAGSDTITFSDGTGGTVNFTDTTPETITVNVGGTLLLSSSLIVEGPGADRLSISGNNATGVFSVGAGSLDVTLSKLSIINGSAPNRGGIVSGSSGVLRVTQCTLSGNTSVVGAAILNTGTGSVLVAQSTISGNTASNSGGAISNFSTGSVTLVQCTLSGNNASSGNGGGINNASTGSITVLQSTVTSNTASGTGGGIRNVGAGVVTIANTTIAGNTGGGNPDVEGAFTSNGGNLIGNAGTATGFINGVNNDQVGNGASPINPQLAALANNGGPTRTHALLAGSPALNAGLPANIPADTFDLDGDTNVAEPIPFDQRGTGFTRAIGTVDIGAFEAAPPEITVFDGSGIAGAQRTDNTGGHSFGVVAVGTSSVPQTFTIQNTGNGPMALGTLTVTGLQQGEFSVTQPVSTTLTPNATTTFTVTFSPTATGWKNAIINIPSNDADENPFRIIVRGANAGSPDQMPLPGQTNTFPGNARGYWFTAPTDMTIVGVRVPTTASTGAQSIAVMRFNAVPPVFSASTNAFTTLYLTQNNPDSGVLSVNIPVTAGTIIGVLGTRGGLNSYAPGDLDTFILGMPVRLERLGMQFPLGTTAPRDIWREFGSSTSISRVDLYTLPGTPAVQEIAVEGNAANISNGDTTPDSADHTDFGSNPVNTGSVTRTFTVRNTSIHALNVTLGSISISGPNAGDFTVTSAPPSSVLSSTSATFQVTFDPSAPGLRTATLSIPNNDGDENPFTFALQGTGLPPVVSLATANAGDADAVEGSVNTGLYTFTRSDSEGPLTVGFQLHPSSTATAGTDFTLSGANSFSSTTGAGTVTFANGSTTATVTLTALVESPNGAEAAETARLDLLANPGVYDLGATTTATVSIAPNSFLVINTNDSGTGSLRQALSNADAISGDDVIAFDATVFATAQTIVVTSELGINSNVIIPGPAAGLTVQAASTAANVFNVLAGVVTFRELTISNGSNGLVKNSSADLTVIGCTIVGNLNNGFVANTATSHLINSTFSGNGTGIAQILPMPLVNVTNCTISGNTTGLSSGGGVSLRNTLCVGNNTNTSGPFTNAGGNIATGTAAAAGLAASLQNNGGPTQTYALLNGSPAINAGVNALAVDQNNVSLGFDQRGAPNLRIRGPVVDIGAVEAFAFEPTITASTTDEDTQSTSGLVVSANTADGGLTTHYKITGILNGTLFQNDGTTVIAEGSYITKAEGAAGLKFTPSLNLNTPNTPAGFGFSAQAAIGTSAGDERGVAVPVVITVNSINDLPTVVAPGLPDIRLTIGDVVVIPLGANFADVDLQTLTFTVSGNTVPAKASASITGTTNVTVTGLTFGVTDLTIQADDGTMGLVTDTFQVAVGTVNPTPTMPATPPAGWRVNSQTALFDIDVPVQNTTAFDINGFRLTVDLSAYAVSHPTLRLINYSSPAGVLPAYVDYPYPVAIGETVNVRLSFFVATRVMPNPFNPTLTVTKLTTSAVAGPLPAGTYTQAVIQKNEAGRILLTWPSTPGRWYRIYYSANLTTWTPSATPIQASANQVQWIDSGAPFTQTPPAGSRFYQVTEIPAPAPAPPP